MSMTYWPSMMPQTPMAGGFQYAPQRNKVSFQPEIGPSIDRRRASATNKIYNVKYDLTSFDQLIEFERWFERDLKDGLLSFLWICPVEQTLCEWKFGTDDPPYQVDPQRGTYVTLDFKLMKLGTWNV